MKLYHATTEQAAASILSSGFRDAEGTYMTRHVYRGVWLSDVPLNENEGAKGNVLLLVELPEETFVQYEWVEEGKAYREALIPAEIINRTKSVARVLDDEFCQRDVPEIDIAVELRQSSPTYWREFEQYASVAFPMLWTFIIRVATSLEISEMRFSDNEFMTLTDTKSRSATVLVNVAVITNFDTSAIELVTRIASILPAVGRQQQTVRL